MYGARCGKEAVVLWRLVEADEDLSACRGIWIHVEPIRTLNRRTATNLLPRDQEACERVQLMRVVTPGARTPPRGAGGTASAGEARET